MKQAVYPASDEAPYVTGENWEVCDGRGVLKRKNTSGFYSSSQRVIVALFCFKVVYTLLFIESVRSWTVVLQLHPIFRC
jgi:hypothetical protein